MKTVSPVQDRAGIEEIDASELALPPSVQVVLGELVNAAKDGLLALSVGVGLGVLHEVMETEVDEVVGPKSKHDTDRAAVRHGHEGGEVTLGGRRVGVSRPRVRTADGESEVALGTYRHFADRDPLTRLVLEQMLAGVSTRRFVRTREPVGQQVIDTERSVSKSAVSRQFVARTTEHLQALMNRRLDDVRLAVLMLDGIDLKGRTNVVALGITTDGVKIPLGLWEGSSENATSRPHCWLISSTAASMSNRACCACSTAARRCARLCVTCSASTPPFTAVSATRSATCSITSPSATVRRSSGASGRRG
jgi:putative transposase